MWEKMPPQCPPSDQLLVAHLNRIQALLLRKQTVWSVCKDRCVGKGCAWTGCEFDYMKIFLYRLHHRPAQRQLAHHPEVCRCSSQPAGNAGPVLAAHHTPRRRSVPGAPYLCGKSLPIQVRHSGNLAALGLAERYKFGEQNTCLIFLLGGQRKSRPA